jgi:hypothetical protein
VFRETAWIAFSISFDSTSIELPDLPSSLSTIEAHSRGRYAHASVGSRRSKAAHVWAAAREGVCGPERTHS